MKLYLDDERKAPDGWWRSYTVDQTIKLLDSGVVKELSLDHDLGDPNSTGYDVLLWIEAAVVEADFNPPTIFIHTANSSARVKMELAVAQILKLKSHDKT